MRESTVLTPKGTNARKITPRLSSISVVFSREENLTFDATFSTDHINLFYSPLPPHSGRVTPGASFPNKNKPRIHNNRPNYLHLCATMSVA